MFNNMRPTQSTEPNQGTRKQYQGILNNIIHEINMAKSTSFPTTISMRLVGNKQTKKKLISTKQYLNQTNGVPWTKLPIQKDTIRGYNFWFQEVPYNTHTTHLPEEEYCPDTQDLLLLEDV
jgi:hypothetical protein